MPGGARRVDATGTSFTPLPAPGAVRSRPTCPRSSLANCVGRPYGADCFLVAQPVGGTSRCGTDGTHVTVAGLAGTNTDSNVDVGTGGTVATAWIGHVCEAMVFTGELNTAIVFSLEQALAEKWQLFNSYKVAA